MRTTPYFHFKGDCEGALLHVCDTPDAEPMKGVALLPEPDGVAAGAALFARLSQGGRLTTPFSLPFRGAHYGNFTDRFGVQRAMNCAAKP